MLDYALRTAIDGNEHLGFTCPEQSCSRHHERTITDTDFADDIAPISDSIKDAIASVTQGRGSRRTNRCTHQ